MNYVSIWATMSLIAWPNYCSRKHIFDWVIVDIVCHSVDGKIPSSFDVKIVCCVPTKLDNLIKFCWMCKIIDYRIDMDGVESSQTNLLWPLDTFYYKVLNKKGQQLNEFPRNIKWTLIKVL